MSENNKKTFCPECGAEVNAKEEKKTFNKILNAIRGVLEDEVVDTDEELEKALIEEETLKTSPDATAKAAKPSLRGFFKMIFGNRLINRLIIFLIAVAMLVMTFMPFTTYQVKMSDETVYTVNYSGVDMVQNSIFSMFASGTVSDIDTAAYEQALQNMPNPAEKVALIRQMTLAFSIYTQKGAHLTSMLTSMLFVAYAILCTLLVIFAGVNLFSEFFTGKKSRNRVKRFASDGVLCFIVCLLPALCFAMLQACELCTGRGVLRFVEPVGGAHLSWTAVLTLVLAFIAAILSCLSHSVGVTREDRRYFDRRRVKHILSVVLIIAVFISTFLPFIQINVIDIQTGKEMVMGVNLWDIREMTANEWMHYYNSPERINQEYIAALGAMPSLSEYEGEIFMNTLIIPSNVQIVFTLFAVMGYFTLFLLLFAGVWLFATLRRGFFGKKRRFMINSFRILTFICVCFVFLFVMMLKNAMDFCMRGDMMYVMKFSFGGGVLLMFLCSLLGLSLRMKEKKSIVYADEDYDNAETSYAPYVLKEKKPKKPKMEKKNKNTNAVSDVLEDDQDIEEAETEEAAKAEEKAEATVAETAVETVIETVEEIAEEAKAEAEPETESATDTETETEIKTETENN